MYRRFEPETIKTAVPVTLKRVGGIVERGRVILPFGKSLDDVLNGPGGFVEFHPYGHEVIHLAKSAIRSIELSNVPQPSEVNRRLDETNASVDPYDVLGVTRGTPMSGIKAAYRKMAKLYHPDRYQADELPDEVRSYLAGMARRVNAAYAALQAPNFVGGSASSAA